MGVCISNEAINVNELNNNVNKPINNNQIKFPKPQDKQVALKVQDSHHTLNKPVFLKKIFRYINHVNSKNSSNEILHDGGRCRFVVV